jgi:hypothetical protein
MLCCSAALPRVCSDREAVEAVLECARKAGTLVYGAPPGATGPAVWTGELGMFLDARFQQRTLLLTQPLELRDMNIAQVCLSRSS